jgi:fumarylacetoacetate (FAA) hydrolase family protein
MEKDIREKMEAAARVFQAKAANLEDIMEIQEDKAVSFQELCSIKLQELEEHEKNFQTKVKEMRRKIKEALGSEDV